jgi:hypothetical protein
MVAAVSACTNVKDTPSHYYAFDSLISAQITYLTHSKARLTKTASLDDRADSISFISPDSAGWSKELGVFLQLDVINKSIYRDKYNVHDGKDPKSNLTVRYYDAKNESVNEVPVPLLRIYYQGNLNNIKRIEGIYQEENSLYRSSQVLSLDLQDIHNKTVLTSYTIKGSQKMIMADSLLFSIDARIISN